MNIISKVLASNPYYTAVIHEKLWWSTMITDKNIDGRCMLIVMPVIVDNWSASMSNSSDELLWILHFHQISFKHYVDFYMCVYIYVILNAFILTILIWNFLNIANVKNNNQICDIKKESEYYKCVIRVSYFCHQWKNIMVIFDI